MINESNRVKRLFYDIETSPAIGTFWKAGYKLNISYKNIVINPAIICVCYKWEHEDEIHFLQWDFGDDRKLIQDFIPIMESSDEIVAHNGDGFDQPWIRQRALFHNIPMSYDITEMDTLKLARKRAGKGFLFQSNTLDYIARYLGVGKKTKTTFDLWYDITIPCFVPQAKPMTEQYDVALNEMVEYCKTDVQVLEDVYHRLKPYSPMKIHEGVQIGGNRWDCQKCGSGNTKVNKTTVTAAGMKRVQWTCKECDTYSHTTARSILYAKHRWEADRNEFNEKL